MGACYGNWDILHRIGRRLERLVNHAVIVLLDENVDKVKLYCLNINSGSVRFLYSGANRTITRILASYGDQLEYGCLNLLDEDVIRNVAAVCPNARFHSSVDYDHGLSRSSWISIGPKLESVALC